MRVTSAVVSMVAATYVRDIDLSGAFYGRLGFHERSRGTGETSAWSSLYHGEHSLLLVSTTPPLDIPQLPLLFYFYLDHLDSIVEELRAAGVEVTHVGHPQHAQGGEARTADPDGNTILLGQRERSSGQPPPAAEDKASHFSLLREAAAMVAGSADVLACQVTNVDFIVCGGAAEVKLADSWGDSVWSCLQHADEILLTVDSAFIAKRVARGIAGFRSPHEP